MEVSGTVFDCTFFLPEKRFEMKVPCCFKRAEGLKDVPLFVEVLVDSKRSNNRNLQLGYSYSPRPHGSDLPQKVAFWKGIALISRKGW